MPIYHRLDFKLSRELPKLPLHPYLYTKILNAYDRRNAYKPIQFAD